MSGLTMDGRHYRVRVIFGSMEESAELVEGINAAKMLSGRKSRDLDGTYYSHSMDVEMDPRYPQDYDDLFDALAAPVESHTIVMPHGQGTVTYDAEVSVVRRRGQGVMAGRRRWTGITASFASIRPNLRPGEENT